MRWRLQVKKGIGRRSFRRTQLCGLLSMFCMGQDQSKGVELEDKVVESQPYGVTRTMKVPQICINVFLTREEFEMFRRRNFRELLRYNIVTICNKSHYLD